MARSPDNDRILGIYNPDPEEPGPDPWYPDPEADPDDTPPDRRKTGWKPSPSEGTSGGQRVNPVVGSSRLASESKQAADNNIEAFLTKAMSGSSGEKFSVAVSDFRYGLITSLKRGTRPIGSLEDMQNFLINKVNGALVQRHGYTALFSGVTDIESGVWEVNDFLEMSVDTPSTTSMYVCAGVQSGVYRYLQKPFFQGSATANNNWVEVSEHHHLQLDGEPSDGDDDKFLVKTAASTVSSTDDYYNGWIIFNTDVADPNDQGYLLITDYNGSTKEITTSDNVPAAWAANENVTLYRFFHDNPTFTATHNGANVRVPIIQMGDNWIASGGRGSTVGYKPIWSGYLYKTFFPNATPFTYWGTYVTEAEIKSTAGYTSGTVAAANGTNQLDVTKKWFLAFVLETDDGQFSAPDLAGGDTLVSGGTEEAISCRIDIEAARINKRLRYVNVFLGSSDDTAATSIDWVDYHYITRYDMLGNDFSYQATAAAKTGYHYKTVTLDNSDWELRGENMLEFLGVDGAYTTSTVSFNYVTAVADRLFVADFYDYTAAKTYSDQVRYSGFGGNGIPQINVLPNIDEFNQTTIGTGDASNIQNIVGYQGILFIIKDNSCYSISITEDSTVWILEKIANIGTDIPYSVAETPFGVCWVKTGEDIYIWNRGYPKSLTNNTIKETFLGLTTTNKTSWRGFYDPLMRSYSLYYHVTATATYKIYATHFDVPILGNYAWTKHDPSTSLHHISASPDGKLHFGLNGGGAVYTWGLTAEDDNGTNIAPFFDTGDYILNEKDITAVQEWYMTVGNNTAGSWANNLDVEIHVDGSSVGTYTNLTKTKASGFYKALLPLTAIGRRIRFKFNTNATRATYDKDATEGPLTIYEVGFNGEIRKLLGDASHSL